MKQSISVALLLFASIGAASAATTQTITFQNPGTQTLGAASFPVNATTTALGLQVIVTTDSPAVCTVSQTSAANIVTLVAPGVCQLKAGQLGGTVGGVTYDEAATVPQMFLVAAPPLTINFPNPGNQVMGTNPFTIIASTNVASLPVTLTSTTPSVCTVAQTPNPNTVTLLATGTCSITATQQGGTAGNVTYGAAAPVSQSFLVKPQFPGVDAVLGIGSLVTGHYTNYTTNGSANALAGTQIGNVSPQLLAGVAFQLPISILRGGYVAKHHHIGVTPSNAEGDIGANKWHDAYRPFHAFVSLKFSTDSSQSLVGYTFGVTYRLQKYLDFLAGYTLTSFQEPSPGLRAAAAYVVATNPKLYPTFNAAALNNNHVGAFDGFPLQCVTGALNCGANPPATGAVAGTALFSGTALEQHFRGGFMIGISVPVSLNTIFNIPKAGQ